MSKYEVKRGTYDDYVKIVGLLNCKQKLRDDIKNNVVDFFVIYRDGKYYKNFYVNKSTHFMPIYWIGRDEEVFSLVAKSLQGCEELNVGFVKEKETGDLYQLIKKYYDILEEKDEIKNMKEFRKLKIKTK